MARTPGTAHHMKAAIIAILFLLAVPAGAAAAPTAPGGPGASADWTEADKDGYATSARSERARSGTRSTTAS